MFAAWPRRAVLALMLPLSPVLGNLAAYAMVLVGLGLLVVGLFQRRLAGPYREPLALMLLLAFAVLAICFAVTAEAPADVIYAVNFIAFPLAGPLLWVLSSGAAPGRAALVATLALAGAAVALAAVLAGLALGDGRGSWLTLGAIRLSNTAILFGFLALIGWFVVPGPRRWVFLAGPPVGLAVTLLTQSRGPLIPFALLVAVALAFSIRRAARPGIAALVALVVIAGVTVFAISGGGRLAALPGIVHAMLTGGEVVDETAGIRLALYQAGVRAFLAAPVIGHGWSELMTSIVPFLPPAKQQFATLPQLHNDVLDFAVAAGVLGMGVYLLILAAPIVAALRSPLDSQRSMRVYGAVVLVGSYAGSGLTDLMFGFEFHTALYVALSTILIGYCRDRPPEPS